MKITLTALLLGAALATPLAASAQYDNGYHRDYGDRGGRRQANVSGRIASVQGSDFTLDNGETVFLHNGTVINPTGRRLHAGQNVTVSGERAGRGRINADEVDVQRRDRDGR